MGGPVTFTEQLLTGPAYPMPIVSLAYNPADSVDYFIGKTAATPTTTAGALYRSYFIRDGFLRFVLFQSLIAGVLGTGETVTLNIRVSDTTDYLIGTSTFDAALRVISNNVTDSNGNSPYVTSADFWELKLTTPAWVTNPTGVVHSGDIYVSSQPG